MVDFGKVRSLAILIFPDVEELDFVGVHEVFGNCSRMIEEGELTLNKPVHVDIVAAESQVICRNGLKVVPGKVTSDFSPYDALVVPGGRGIRKLMRDEQFLKNLNEYARDHVVCSVCTGSLVLGAAGVLQGKSALTHSWYSDELQKYARVASGRVHVDGNIVTGAGISSSIDVGLKLLEMLYDKSVARKVAERLELPATYYMS